MNDNRRIVIISLLMVIFIITVFIVYFMYIFATDKKNIVPAPSQKSGPVNVESPQQYEIPVNAVPVVQEIEESIAKRENERKELSAIHAGFEQVKIKEAEVAPLPTETPKGPAKTDVLGAAYPGEHKKVVFPTREERKDMETRGIMSF